MLCLFGDGQCPIARLAGFCKLLPRDPQGGEVHLEKYSHAHVANFATQWNCFFVRALGCLPPLHSRVEQAEVAQRNADVLGEAQRAIIGETCLVVPQRLLELTADVGDDAEVLRRHRRELGFAGAAGAFPCLEI